MPTARHGVHITTKRRNLTSLYVSLHDATPPNASSVQLKTIVCGSAEQLATWAERRASWKWGRFPPPGHADSQKATLRAAHAQTLVCMAPGCAALVDLQVARRLARAAGRDSFEPGDGCAGATCSAKSWPARHKRQQKEMAAALRGDSRVLVLWPRSTAARVDLAVAPRCITRRIADDVLRDEDVGRRSARLRDVPP